MTLQDILSRLDGVSGSGDQYSARCPAHDDQKASLSVASGEDGKILLNCHAGCTKEEIVEALGLHMSDLFQSPTPEQAFRPQIVARYDYTDENGVFLYQKTRMSNKSFYWSHKDSRGDWKKGRNRQAVLYNLPCLKGSESVYLVEGEKDVETLKSHSAPAVSPPDGAQSKWNPGFTEALRGKRVVILPDNDKPGRKMAHRAAAELTGAAASVKVLDLSKEWPWLPEKGDISDILEKEPAEDVFMKLEALEASTPEWNPDEAGKENLHLVRAADVPYEPPRWLIAPYFQKGKGTLIQAEPGTGKTAFVCAVAAHISTGRPILNIQIQDPGDVLILSVEDDLPVLRGRIEASGGDLTRCHFMTNAAGLTFNSPEIEAAIKAVKAKAIIFDPFQAFLGANVDMFRSNETRPELAKLFEMADRNDCSVVIIAHTGKNRFDKSPIIQALGSVDIPAAMRSIIHIVRNPGNEDECIAVHVKCSNAPKGPSIAYSIGDRGGVHWNGFSPMTIEDLNTVAKRKEKGVPYEREPLVQVFNQLITDRPGGGFWSYDDVRAAGLMLLGFPPFSDPNDIRTKLKDCNFARELVEKDGLVVTCGHKSGSSRGIKIERYIAPGGYQTKLQDH